MKPSCIPLLLLVLHVTPARAEDLPPALRLGSCERLKFDLTGATVPDVVDLLVQVDLAGRPISASTLTPTALADFDAAVVSFAMSCRYAAAMTLGKPVPGQVRFVLPIRQGSGQRPGALPAIGNVTACAPTSDDYPAVARRQNQAGTTRVSFTVDDKGKLEAFGVVRSSGHLLLDYTALIKLAGCTFVPGKSPEGAPIGGSFIVEYVWKLQ
jgi:TonB family protein